MKQPLISIVTVTYNAVNTIEQSILSVISQDKNIFEYIIIDGGSTDGTLEYIDCYQHELNYCISEPDSGIYNAMNKGIDVATGDWIFFLGADDRLMPNVLSIISSSLIDEFDLVFGDICFDTGRKYSSSFSIKTILHNTIHHQSAFYNKRLFETFRYDTSLKIMSDYELNLMIYINRKRFNRINIIIADCNRSGASSSLGLSMRETNFIRRKYFSKSLNFILKSTLKLKYLLHYGFKIR